MPACAQSANPVKSAKPLQPTYPILSSIMNWLVVSHLSSQSYINLPICDSHHYSTLFSSPPASPRCKPSVAPWSLSDMVEPSGVAANSRESPRIHAVSPPEGTSKSWGNPVVLSFNIIFTT